MIVNIKVGHRSKEVVFSLQISTIGTNNVGINGLYLVGLRSNQIVYNRLSMAKIKIYDQTKFP